MQIWAFLSLKLKKIWPGNYKNFGNGIFFQKTNSLHKKLAKNKKIRYTESQSVFINAIINFYFYMKNEKSIRHEMMNEVRNDLKRQNERRSCLYRLIFDEIDQSKRDMYIQLLQKRDYIFGLEDAYIRLAQTIRLKDNKSDKEEQFLAFVKKHQLL